jgi:hypothetical protein
VTRRAPGLRRHGGHRARAAAPRPRCVGQPWDEAALQPPQAALVQDFTPMSDLRASAGYRLQVAQNLLRRFWLETRARTIRCRRRRRERVRPRGEARAHEQAPRRCPSSRCRPRPGVGAVASPAVGPFAPARIGPPARGRRRALHRRHPRAAGTLHAALGLSPLAHGVIEALDLDRCARCPAWWTCSRARHPRRNDCGPLVHDDPILAGEPGEVLRYRGQPVFAVVATTRDAARRAAALAPRR